MLLVGRHGTTKYHVKSLVPRLRTHTASFCGHFSTTSPHCTESSLASENDAPATSSSRPKSFGLLGGGVTGLSAAHFLTEKYPDSKITIYERSKRLGGWVDSETIEVDGGHVLFEWGPRSLRPDLAGPGRVTVRLLYDLGLVPEIVATDRDHVAARNRFIYYPDHLVRMPAPYARTGFFTNFFLNLRTLLTEPIFKGMIGGMLAEPTVKTRPKYVEDESVGDFVRRRFGPTITDNMLSALFHGIYAGDIYKLSARALLPKLWYLEIRDPEGSGVIPELLELMFKKEQIHTSKDMRVLTEGDSLKTYLQGDEAGQDAFKGVLVGLNRQSVYTFTKGIGHLTRRLEQALHDNSNVRIVKSTTIREISRDPESGKLLIDTTNPDGKEEHDYVISTISPSGLSTLQADSRGPIPDKEAISDTATVMVVNLYYSNPNLTNPYRGFGYLIPQSIPMDQNPERALGVIFASETSGLRGPSRAETDMQEHSQSSDITSSEAITTHWQSNHQDTAPGTKLTVMLGGHWWADWQPSDIPTPEIAIEMAKSLLARHMNITDSPLLAKAKLQQNAIPQYHVGHRKAMARVHDSLQWYQGRLRVAGPAWQGGVGVNDCIQKAWEVVDDIGENDDLDRNGGWKTGIEQYTRDEEWVTVDARSGRTAMVDINGYPEAQGKGSVLKDYERQLVLLEQQGKKRGAVARQEAEQKSARGAKLQKSERAREEFWADLRRLEQFEDQTKERLTTMRKEISEIEMSRLERNSPRQK